jgi:hypothetical protein
MGAPGWDDAPYEQPEKAGWQKRVTIGWPYYENPNWLREQLLRVEKLPRNVKNRVSVSIADDGSPRHPAEPVIRSIKNVGVPIRLFRIEQDVRWNWLAARNIIMRHVPDHEWVLLTDIDHVVPAPTLWDLQWRKHDPKVVYRFNRMEHDGTPIHPHPNSFFINEEAFWKVGGYDEALSGHYGTDGDWRRRAAAKCEVRTLRIPLVRYEHQGDSSTLPETGVLRKQPQDAGKKAIIRTRGAGWRPRVLSFPFHEVHL